MASHPFAALAPEYTALWQSMKILRMEEAVAVARTLVGKIARYQAVSASTDVPPVEIAGFHYRESSANFLTYLGNGQPLGHVTTIVPKGRGPWPSWEAGAIDALHLEGLDKIKDWSIPRALYESESWNGFGPRNRGIHSGYLWAGTQHYTCGKYVADGEWDPNHADTQLGIAPLMWCMMKQMPSLTLPGMLATVSATPAAPLPAPVGVGGDLRNTTALQTALNRLGASIDVDGSYGRETKAAVRAFQAMHGLTVDGSAGAKETIPAILDALKALTPA